MASTKKAPKREPLAVLRKKRTELKEKIKSLESNWMGKQSVQNYTNVINEIDQFLTWEYKRALRTKPPKAIRDLAAKRVRKLRAKRAVLEKRVVVLKKDLVKLEKLIEEGRTGRHKCSECGLMHEPKKAGENDSQRHIPKQD